MNLNLEYLLLEVKASRMSYIQSEEKKKKRLKLQKCTTRPMVTLPLENKEIEITNGQ